MLIVTGRGSTIIKELELLLPKDEADDKNVILEVRAGTGGDEAALFAGDLYRMYQRYTDLKGWKLEIISASEAAMGGYKEIIASVSACADVRENSTASVRWSRATPSTCPSPTTASIASSAPR